MNTIVFAATSPAAPPVRPSISTLDLLFSSSPIVMGVLLILVSFSIVSWAIILYKWGSLKKCRIFSDDFLDLFWSGKEIDEVYSESKRMGVAPIAKIFQAAYVELQRLLDRERQKTSGTAKVQRVSSDASITNLERAITRASNVEMMRLESSLTFLATAGSTAPFIGLFGTVWGIMNAFQNIGAQGGASLSVVAPGIAEALIATAVGLLCAIPAVMGYNYFTHRVQAMRVQMETFAADYLNILKRNYFSS